MGRRLLAHPYAKAAFLYAKEQNQLSDWNQYLTCFSLFIQDSQIQSRMNSQAFSSEKLFSFFTEVFSAFSFSKEQENFFRLLSEAGRLALLPEVVEIFEQLCTEASQLMFAEVTSARPLTDLHKKQLRERLKARFSQEVELNCHEDPACVAGVRVKVGDWVFDNTLQSRFDRLKNTLGESHV
jgi:F-type H+-transporting ATPase subunit delta